MGPSVTRTVKYSLKGEAGVSYELRTSVSNVVYASDGTPTIASFSASLWKTEGAGIPANISSSIYLNGVIVGSGISVTVNTSSETDSYNLEAYINGNIVTGKVIGVVTNGTDVKLRSTVSDTIVINSTQDLAQIQTVTVSSNIGKYYVIYSSSSSYSWLIHIISSGDNASVEYVSLQSGDCYMVQNTQSVYDGYLYCWNSDTGKWVDMGTLKGKGIKSIDVVYQKSTSNTTSPIVWVTAAPVLPQGYFLWSANHITYSDNTSVYTDAMCIASADNVKTVTEQYALSTNGTTVTGSWAESAPTAQKGYYIWTRTKLIWQDGSITYTTAVCNGYLGTDGTSVTISSQSVSYQISNSGTVIPTGSWSSSVISSTTDNPFLWTRTTITYNDGTSTVSYSVGYKGTNGTSVTISSTLTKYAVTSSNVQPADSAFVFTSIPALEAGQYLWVMTQVTYSDSHYTKAYGVYRTGTDGAQGEKGAALRGPQSWNDCANGFTFKAGGLGDLWKDVVIYGDNQYSCIKNHTKTVDNYPTSTDDNNNGYWQLGDKIELVAAKILLATYALVDNLGVKTIDMKDGNGNILFQAKDGVVTCKTGTFENVNVNNGTIYNLRSPWTFLTGGSEDLPESDNIIMSGGITWLDTHSLGWDSSFSGRRLMVTASNSTINAPANKFFYVNGNKLNNISLNNQIAEMVGYGIDDIFYGWIITNIRDLNTNAQYGKPHNLLAYGIVTASGNTATINYKLFNGGYLDGGSTPLTMGVTWLATGFYRVTFPTAWQLSTSYMVMLTGMGCTGTPPAGAIKASLGARNNGSFDVYTSNNDTEDNGSFEFEIFNFNDM